MATPAESEEFLDAIHWNNASGSKSLNVTNCVACWTDICGFGSLLENNEWDLGKLQDAGVVHLLNEMHLLAGRPFLVGVGPFPNDKVIVLNDGIARTVDLLHAETLNAHVFLIYIREILFTHYLLLKKTLAYKVGVRTVIAGGQKVQYSNTSITGHSILYYDENKVSDYGKKLLDTTFVYNPAEFQMNTAFAKAYTLDSFGSKSGIIVNGLYIESSFFEKINIIHDLLIDINEKSIKIYHSGTLMFELNIINQLSVNLKGLDVVVFHIDKFLIYKAFDGDDIETDLFNQIQGEEMPEI